MAFLIGFLSGVLASAFVNQIWEFLARARANKAAKQLVGTWTAYKQEGRGLSKAPMAGAGPTVVILKSHWWSADAGVLSFDSYDEDEATGKRRTHSGRIVMDSKVPWMATRIDRYDDSHEVAQQHLVISSDPSVVYLFSMNRL